MQIQLVTKHVNKPHTIDLKVTCDTQVSIFNINIKTYTVFTTPDVIDSRYDCTILMQVYHYMFLAVTTKTLGEVTILANSHVGSVHIEHYLIYWFKTTSLNSYSVNIDAIECLHKKNSLLFKDILRLEVCPDSSQCFNTELFFEKPKTIDTNYRVIFSDFAFLRLWYVSHAMQTSMYLIDEYIINSTYNTGTLHFLYETGIYQVAIYGDNSIPVHTLLENSNTKNTFDDAYDLIGASSNMSFKP